MRKVKAIIGLLILLSVVYTIPVGSARSEVLPEEVIGPDLPKEPLEDVPENFTNMDTTNPYKNITDNPLDEKDLVEGPRPLNVLIFGDEEAVVKEHWVGSRPGPLGYRIPIYKDWKDYAVWQIERGDEALVALFGIDIRVRGALTWDSDDSKQDMEGLFYEFWYENEHYLRSEYDGVVIDAIIGITGQETVDGGGIAHQSLNVILLQWVVYWMDDNLVQTEVSHLFYAPDHSYGEKIWCIMGNWKKGEWGISEDGYTWVVLREIDITFLTYDYCSDCYNTINSYKDLFPITPGDADLDGDVDATDYWIWKDYYGETIPSWEAWQDGVDPDFDNNGIVTASDWTIWQQNCKVHALGIISVTASDSRYGWTTVYAGWEVTVTVKVKNKGHFTENFAVTVYYYRQGISTSIRRYVINLAPGANITLTTIWDTTGISYGTAGLNYTIYAHATVHPDEIRKDDNTYFDGTITVRYPGDLDGDGDVDWSDFVLFAAGYLTFPPDPILIPLADLDYDGDVDGDDFILFTGYYGHTP